VPSADVEQRVVKLLQRIAITVTVNH
jgi:hypothetical protein